MSDSGRPPQRPVPSPKPGITKSLAPTQPEKPRADPEHLRALRQAQEDRDRKHRVRRPRTPIINMSSSVLLTGFYESMPFLDTQNSAFTLQINQAGQTLVGWFSEPPSMVGNRVPLQSYRPGPKDPRLGYGIFIAYDMQERWRKINSTEYHLPIDIIRIPKLPENGINDLDPTPTREAHLIKGGINHSGWLVLEPEPDAVALIKDPLASLFPRVSPLPPPKSWVVTAISFNSSESPSDSVRRTSRRARLSYEAILQQGDLLREALMATHAAVLPESFIEMELKRVTRLWVYGPFGLLDKGPPDVEKALDKWLAATNNIEKKATRDAVLSTLIGFHKDLRRFPLPYHRELLRDLFRAHARTSVKQTKNGAVSYYTLYQEMINEELQDSPSAVSSSYLQPITEFGTLPTFMAKDKRFRYLLSFTPLPGMAGLPAKATEQIIKSLGGMGMNAGIFGVGLTRQRVEYETEQDGSIKVDRISGNPVVKKILEEIDITKDISITSRYAAKVIAVGLSPSPEPVKVALDTYLDDLRYEDLADSSFHYVSVTGLPEAKVGALLQLKQATTGFFVITLPKRRGLQLFGSVTEGPSITSPTVDEAKELIEQFGTPPKSLGDAINQARTPLKVGLSMHEKGAEQYAEEWLGELKLSSLKVDFSKILSVNMGYGWIGAGDWGAMPSPARAALLPDPTRIESGSVTQSSMVFFARDSATFGNQEPWPSEPKFWITFYLETFVASNLYLLLNPDTELSIKGYASPEGPEGPLQPGEDDPYNHELSLDRASAVYDAIRAALHIYDDNWTHILDLDGYGEVPSRNPLPDGGNLIDPPSTTNMTTFKAWCVSHPDQVAQWPYWRKVEIELAGLVSFRLFSDPHL